MVRFPACYFWLAFCNPHQILQLNRNSTARRLLFLPLFLLHPFLGELKKDRKRLLASSGLSVHPSIHPSVRMEQLGSHCKDFNYVWNLRIFLKFVYKIQFGLNCEKSSKYFTWRSLYIYDDIWLNSSYDGNIPDKICGKNQNIIIIKKSIPKFVPFMR